jgi:phage shock protein A
MSIGRRIATLFRVKANKALDRAEDPREMLDYSYEQQLARMKAQLPASAAPPAVEGPE